MKKIISILLTLFILAGCTGLSSGNTVTSTDDAYLEEISATYLEKLVNFKTKKRNKDNITDNEEFDEFLDKMFIDLVCDDYASLHNLIKDYKTLDIDKPEVTLGEIKYGPDEETINREIEEYNALQGFDYDSLSYRQQIDFECVEYSIYEDLSSVAYYKYSRLFDNDGSFVSSLIDYFINFEMWDTESVEDYLTLLKDVKRYTDDAISYTDNQYKDGIYYSDYSLNNTIEYIESFVSKTDDNTLITAFKNNIDECEFLSAEEKNRYIEESSKTVTEEIIPSFNSLKEKLEKYKGKTKAKDVALCNVSEDYAKTMIFLQCSSNESVDEIYDELIDSFNDSVKLINSYDESSEVFKEYEELYDDERFSIGYKGLVDELIESLPEDDEVKPSLKYTIDELDKSIANNTTTAYYVEGVLDSIGNNIIKVNPNLVDKDLELYMTLAHEAVPGHMYQINAYSMSSPKYIREAMSFIGYTEGYATFAEYVALDNLEISEELEDYIINNEMIDYFYSALLDISINYYGYGTSELCNMFGFDSGSANQYINVFTDMATAYEPYGVGYMKMMKLYNSTRNSLGDKFDMDEYLEILIENGPMPYPILESVIDEYIESK